MSPLRFEALCSRCAAASRPAFLNDPKGKDAKRQGFYEKIEGQPVIDVFRRLEPKVIAFAPLADLS